MGVLEGPSDCAAFGTIDTVIDGTALSNGTNDGDIDGGSTLQEGLIDGDEVGPRVGGMDGSALAVGGSDGNNKGPVLKVGVLEGPSDCAEVGTPELNSPLV